VNKELLISNLRFRVNVVLGLYHVISAADWNPGITCFKQKPACPLLFNYNDALEKNMNGLYISLLNPFIDDDLLHSLFFIFHDFNKILFNRFSFFENVDNILFLNDQI
jgi:hypothetical protein